MKRPFFFSCFSFLIVFAVSCGCLGQLSEISHPVTSIPIPTATISPDSKLDVHSEIGVWDGDFHTGFCHEFFFRMWYVNNGSKVNIRCNDGIITTLYHENISFLEDNLAIGNLIIPPGRAINNTIDTYNAVDEMTDDPANEHLSIMVDCIDNGKIIHHLASDPLPSWNELPSWYGSSHYWVKLQEL